MPCFIFYSLSDSGTYIETRAPDERAHKREGNLFNGVKQEEKKERGIQRSLRTARSG